MGTSLLQNLKMGQLQGKYVLNKRDIEYLSKHTKISKDEIRSNFIIIIFRQNTFCLFNKGLTLVNS